ncbi:MAG: imidazole glycerol phosphate synthase subunit HisH [Vulcanococcus sp.]|jgi:glutamine amidotransferase|uniref:imidazole glycerol phosphate synthase subunit HisH n=1 Tax=Vulcanococcus sp. TaxID=2856995 RepID=UPI0025E42178|nr:imidazole glycerol phosphate synthase subunit HisH [Vulcanococcus sp.]MBW0180983.1 imidazole glycerol phosphate synthase subunit HisH [Vulcanococcus sp.]
MTNKVAIVDYGAGNLRSVIRALTHLGAHVTVQGDPDRLRGYSHFVLPGVGSFRRAMDMIRSRGLDQLLCERVAEGVPLLGICLGMQLLAAGSSEDGETQGLGLIAGEVDRFSFDPAATGLKIPHVGFDAVTPAAGSLLFSGFGQEVDFYFTHSFRLLCATQEPVAAEAWHGEFYVAAVEQGVVAGTQFHPEKSQANGLKLLANFLERF